MAATSDQIILSHLWLPRVIAQSKRLPHLTDDLEQIGRIGLIQAAHKFDISRGFKFATFARHRINGAIRDYLARPEHLPPPAIVSTAPETPERALQREQLVDVVRTTIDDLSPRERSVIEDRWFREVKQRDMAKAQGITEARIAQIHARAMRKLRNSPQLRMLLG